MAKNFVLPIPLTKIDSATFTGAYQLVSGTLGITEASFIIKIINNSNVDVTVSYDGTHDHDFVPKGTIAQFNFQANAQPNNYAALLAKWTKIYVKGAAGVGSVFLSGWYSPQN